MQNIFIDVLPPWVETGLQPAFYDLESGTVLQQTARMYAKVKELTLAFNTFSENVTNEINRFEDETNDEIERFEDKTNDEIERFEGVVNGVVEEYIKKFNDLHDYVEDYFDNLDVQKEINNKLDVMAEDGTLADIIAAYIQLKGVLAYENVNALKNAENIVKGSFCETYGYYAKGDGGSAKYIIREITNDDTVDDMFIISITADPTNTLIAELIEPSVINVKQLGIKGDNSTDETTKITTALNKGKPLYFPSGTYLISSTITAPNKVNIIGDGESTVFNSTSGSLDIVIDFSGSDVITLCNFSTSNSTFKVYPTASAGQTVQELMSDKDVYISNVLCNTVSTTISGNKTNWKGLFVNTPKPNHYDPRDFEDGKYSRYGIELNNNSGYNAININNVMKENGSYATIPDNSAIGITDGVLSSAPTVLLDMKAERNALAIKNNTATSSASSTSREGTVYELDYKGHVAIGCSTFSETDASGVGTVKLKDNEPNVRFYDTNYPSHITFVRLKDDKFQTAVNGVIRSEYLNNGYHEYSYPIRMKKIADSHGGLIFGTDFSGGKDVHLHAGSSGYLQYNYSNPDASFTSDTGYYLQPCVSGTTANRPTSRLTNDYQSIGFRYFDITLGKPIFWKGTGWVDATGASV